MEYLARRRRGRHHHKGLIWYQNGGGLAMLWESRPHPLRLQKLGRWSIRGSQGGNVYTSRGGRDNVL